MKKYKRVIAVMFMIYLVLAAGGYIGIKSIKSKSDNLYKVEINRIENQIRDEVTQETNSSGITEIDINSLNFLPKLVTGIFVLNLSNVDMESMSWFYDDNNKEEQSRFVPFCDEKNNIVSIVRYNYKINEDNLKVELIYQAGLFILFISIIVVSIYIYKHILIPFNRISEMPSELSKGNMQYELKESKDRYFGRFIWGLGMLRDDLSKHKIKELELVREKKLILLSISHDIKTPLNAINLYCKSIEEGIYKTDEEKINAVRMIEKKSDEIDEFVKEIIRSSKEDVISIEVNTSDVYLKEVVDKVRQNYEEKCQLKKVKFSIGYYDNHLIRCDLDRIYEAIGNLMENAFKYGDGREIAITFSEEEYCQLISVYNSGKCVDENTMTHLFESFYRGSNTDGIAGNGLGLYICSEIMHKMGGDIFAECTKSGMVFTLVCMNN